MDDKEIYQLAKEIFEKAPEETRRRILNNIRMWLRFEILDELESRGEDLPSVEEVEIYERRVEDEAIKFFAEHLRNDHARRREWVTKEEYQDIYDEELERLSVLHEGADWLTALPNDYQKIALEALAHQTTMDRLRQKYPQAF
jgi:hypothetical protein